MDKMEEEVDLHDDRGSKPVGDVSSLIWKFMEILGIAVVVGGIILGCYGINVEIATKAEVYHIIISTSTTLIAAGSIFFAIGDKLRRRQSLQRCEGR